MKTFKDRHGNEWEIDLSLGACERVRDRAGVDLTDIVSTQATFAKLADPFVLGSVLWVLCERQADKRGIGPEEFRDCFNGDTVHAASEALIDETVFFCRAPMRPAMQLAVDKAREADRRMVAAMNANMEQLGREMEKTLAAMSTASVTNSAESLASTRDHGHSEDSSGLLPHANAKRGSTRRTSSRVTGR